MGIFIKIGDNIGHWKAEPIVEPTPGAPAIPLAVNKGNYTTNLSRVFNCADVVVAWVVDFDAGYVSDRRKGTSTSTHGDCEYAANAANQIFLAAHTMHSTNPA